MTEQEKSETGGAPLLAFAELCRDLAATSKKLEKRARMAAYLGSLQVEDAARAALYLAGAPFAETDPRRLQVGGSLLGKALAQLSGASPQAMQAAYRRHGDLGDAAFDLLQERQTAPLALQDLEEAFTALALARGPLAKLQLLLALLERATPLEARYIIKLASGDMRTGVKQSLVEEAAAAAFGAEPAQLRRAVMLNGNLAEVVRMAAAGTLGQATMRLFHPLGFMLASPVDSVEEALARFAEEVALEAAAAGAMTPALRAAQLEDKYDGMRAQLHCGDRTQAGRVGLFSRNREDLSESFPDLIEAFATFGEAVILDGEILAWQPGDERATGRALPFSSLQQRLGRKRVTAEMREATPVIFMAFDLLFESGELLLELPLRERRERLEKLVAAHGALTSDPHAGPDQGMLFASGTGGFARLILAPAVPLTDVEQLEAAYAEARRRGNEGVMLKAAASSYQPGRRGLAWLKLKRELATLDVVITGAEFGNGRRAGVLSDYTFAVRGPGEQLLNVGKAYSGLTDAEIEELSRRLMEQTLEDYGHFRTVIPSIVLEVAFNNLMRSTRHNSGFAMRFPRILRLRDDKPVAQIDSLARVEEIYASQPDKPVES
ncbi:MAG TPA: ATP-dependent DNA ligase [Acidobacteriaceae bacterium]